MQRMIGEMAVSPENAVRQAVTVQGKERDGVHSRVSIIPNGNLMPCAS